MCVCVCACMYVDTAILFQLANHLVCGVNYCLLSVSVRLDLGS